MKPNLFDEVAKAFSGQLSRRNALKRCGGLFAAAFGVSLGLQAKARADNEEAECKKICFTVLCDDLSDGDREACVHFCQFCCEIFPDEPEICLEGPTALRRSRSSKQKN